MAKSSRRATPDREQPDKASVDLPRLLFRFEDVLRAAAEAEGISKAQRTELRLKAGAVAVLTDTTYQSMRIADISKRAGVSHGLFYHYFKDKEDVTIIVLSEMLNHSESIYRQIRASPNLYESLFVPNLYYLRTYDLNAGLMRACLTLADDSARFTEIWNRTVHSWHQRIAASIRRHPSRGAGLPNIDLVAYSIGGLIDQMCRLLYVQRNPFVSALVNEPIDLAETITIIWYRSVYACDPPQDEILHCRRLYARGL